MEASSFACFKLNINGSSHDGVTMGGGIIRNSMAMLVAAFSIFYGVVTNTLAEFYALYDGLELCQALGISQLEVESDSPVVVHTLTRHETNNWRMFYAFHECSRLWLDFNKIKHIFQQANTVVDRLAD